MPNKILSYFLGLCIALLVVAPPLDYTIPLIVNSFLWVYIVVVAGLLGAFLLFQDIKIPLKILAVYLFIACFFSQGPHLSFNAYILVVATFYFYLACHKADYTVLLQFIQAAFWFEVFLTLFQLTGRDVLTGFGADVFDTGGSIQTNVIARIPVFWGTVRQYMRFSSMLAVMSPLLILRSRWYILPITLLCILSQSSNFAISILVGSVVYLLLIVKEHRLKQWIVSVAIVIATIYTLYDLDSVRGAILPANGGRLVSWWVILKTWVMDTAAAKPPLPLYGPFKWSWFLFGHGMDTFLPLFPIYKHDSNPFPQAHNCWLQFLWEIGILGFTLIAAYCKSLCRRLYTLGRYDLLGGLACIATNMFFAFPTRMTQTVLLIIAYAAYCETNASPTTSRYLTLRGANV